MKRQLTVAVAGAAILVAGISGCSSNKSNTSGSGGGSSTSASVNAGGAAGTKVTIDGKDQNVSGSVVCSNVGGSINIAVGGAATGIAAILTDGNPPQVKSVALGNVNGVALGYTPGAGQGNASATKNGNTYTISGSATGIDKSNPMQLINKPFEIDVTCSS